MAEDDPNAGWQHGVPSPSPTWPPGPAQDPTLIGQPTPAAPGPPPAAGTFEAPAQAAHGPSPGGVPPSVSVASGGFDEKRPQPRLPGVLAAAGGLLIISSLGLLISQLPDDNRRITGLLLSIAFEALGLVALFLWRDRPAVAVGVLVSAIGVLPVLVFAFIDPNRPNIAFGSFSRGKGTLSAILAVSAAVWLGSYLVGPGRRFAFYLGAALTSLWLLLLLQIATTSLERLSSGGTSFGSSGSDSGSSFGTDNSFGNPSSTAASTSTRIGVVSLVVGLVYLLLARLIDRRGGTRAGTPFFATAAVILTAAVFAMINPWKTEGAALLAIALGSLLVWLGTSRGRRFTSWYGAFAIAAGTFALIVKLADSNLTVAGLIVLAAGAGLAVLANWLTGRADPNDDVETMTPLPAWLPGAGEI